MSRTRAGCHLPRPFTVGKAEQGPSHLEGERAGEEWDTRSYVLPRGETDAWGRSGLLDTLHGYKAVLLLACPSPHFPFQGIPRHLPFLDGAGGGARGPSLPGSSVLMAMDTRLTCMGLRYRPLLA